MGQSVQKLLESVQQLLQLENWGDAEKEKRIQCKNKAEKNSSRQFNDVNYYPKKN